MIKKETPATEVTKQIGLDRVVLTMNETQFNFIGDDVTEVNVLDGAIRIRQNALNKGLYDVQINCPKLFNDTNENNVTSDKMGDLLDVIQNELSNQGLMVDVAEMRLGSFEVNFNVNDKKFYDVLKLIAKANINDNLKAFYVENKHGIQSVKVKKKEYMVKVYKKSEHLQECFEPTQDEHLVRFEVSTNTTNEKTRLLGDNVTLHGLIEQWERVEEWYRKKIELTIKKPIDKYIKELESACIKQLESGVKPSKVLDDLILREDLIDIIAFENAIRKHYKANKKPNPGRDVKTAHNRIKKTNENRYNQVVGNVAKMDELYMLIGLKQK